MRSLQLLSVLLGLGLVGCIGNDTSSLFVQGYASVEEDDGFCVPSPATNVLQGTLNFMVEDPADPEDDFMLPFLKYDILPRVVNTVIDRTTDFNSDPNIAYVRSFEIEIKQFEGPAVAFAGLPNPFTTPASGSTVDSRQGSGAESEVFLGVGIPSAYAQQLRDAYTGGLLELVVLHVTVNAETIGTSEIESADWKWPVTFFNFDRDVCDDEAGAFDQCAPGQNGGATSIVDCSAL